MLADEIEAIFAGQDTEDGDIDVDGVLAAFERLKNEATVADLPQLVAAIRSPRNNFWTRELLAEPIAELGGTDHLDLLLEAAQLGRDEGHDNDGLNACLIGVAHSAPDKCRVRLEALLARADFRHHEYANWLLEFCDVA